MALTSTLGNGDKPPYTPPSDLQTWLGAGDPPIFVGFGSMVISDTASLVDMIVSAAEQTGARVLVQRLAERGTLTRLNVVRM